MMKQNKTITMLNDYIENCFTQKDMQRQHLSGAGAIFLLEKQLSNFYNKKFAITFSNATTALLTLSLAFGLKHDEIITSPVNWGGSVAPFLLNNKLRFTSFNPVSLALDISNLKFALNEKSKAVLSVDYNGNAIDSKMIKQFCQKNNLKYISDSAQSFGAFHNGKPAGYYADAVILSFSPGKSFFAGEGGAVLTDDETIYEKLIWFSQHPHRQKAVLGIGNYNEYAPLNGRMNPLSAILLNETFESSLDALKNYQNQCFKVLKSLNKSKLIIETSHLTEPASSTFFNFMITLTSDIRLDQLNEWLTVNNEPFTAIDIFPKLIPFDQIFRNQFKGKYNCTNKLMNQINLLKSQKWVILKIKPA